MSRRRTVGVETDPLTYEAYSKMSEAEAVGVAFVHRAEAFEAARWLIDTLKESVPTWKTEHAPHA